MKEQKTSGVATNGSNMSYTNKEIERLKAENSRLRAHLSAIGIVCIGVETKHSQFRRIKCIVEEALQQEGSGK